MGFIGVNEAKILLNKPALASHPASTTHAKKIIMAFKTISALRTYIKTSFPMFSVIVGVVNKNEGLLGIKTALHNSIKL